MPPTRLFDPTPEAERQYVEKNIDRFAAAARAGHERFGRGLVLVSVQPPHAPDKAGIIEYVNHEEADRIWPRTGWPEASTRRAVDEYNPSTGFLVMFLDFHAKSCRLHRFDGVGPSAEDPA